MPPVIWEPTQEDIDLLVGAFLIGWALLVQLTVAMLFTIRWGAR